jgi:site-specific DNA-adenine methylase
MNLGLPYQGSKNTIALDIVKSIPRGGKILDACCGGGAFLMAAALSMRWDSVVGNDLNKASIALLDAVLIHKGQIEYEHPPVCTRQDFIHSLQRIENDDFEIQDCVNKYTASFGNNGKCYLYNTDIEQYKLEAEKMLTAKTLKERRHHYRKFCFMCEKGSRKNELERLERIERLERLQRLERLERLQRLDIFDIDYSEFDVVYFDIPYKGTAKYDFEFDYDRFYDLFTSLDKPCFLSEYNAPFTCVAQYDKVALMNVKSRTGGEKKALEKLYFNSTIEEYKELMGAEYKPIQDDKQLSLF